MKSDFQIRDDGFSELAWAPGAAAVDSRLTVVP